MSSVPFLLSSKPFKFIPCYQESDLLAVKANWQQIRENGFQEEAGLKVFCGNVVIPN